MARSSSTVMIASAGSSEPRLGSRKPLSESCSMSHEPRRMTIPPMAAQSPSGSVYWAPMAARSASGSAATCATRALIAARVASRAAAAACARRNDQ